MRTLILCLCLVVWQILPAQPFFIDAEPALLQNQDGTYSWFFDGRLTPINQPEGVTFSFGEILVMEAGGNVYRKEIIHHENRFSLQSFPPLYNIKLITRHEYDLDNDGITVIQAQRQKSRPLFAEFWLYVVFLVVAFLITFLSSRNSAWSLASIGLAVILTIWSSFYLGWWGYGIGLALITVTGLWNDGSLDYFDFEDFVSVIPIDG